MRSFTYCVALFSVVVLAPMPVRSGGEFKLEPGFMLLFNGKNLDGWREKGAKGTTLEGKTEAFKGRFKVADGLLIYDPKVGGDKYIETTKEFAKDVHFKFDFKPGPKCNNDVLFRGKKFDIIPGNKENKDVKEGEWYTFELIAKDDVLEYKIAGQVARTTKGTKMTSAPLILRAEIGAMEVKNIRVKE